MSDSRAPSPIFSLALPLALVISAVLLAGALGTIRRGDEALEATGSAKRNVTANYAVWSASIAAQSPTLAAANAELKRFAELTRAYLRANGIADSLISSKPFETEALREFQNGNETPRLAGYRLTYRVQVASQEIDKVAKLALQTGDLIDQGVPVVSEPLQYLYTDLASLRGELLAAATSDAKARATSIAGAVGSTVGRVKNVRVGVFQVTPRFSTEVSDYGVNDVTSREKEVTAVVRAEFELN